MEEIFEELKKLCNEHNWRKYKEKIEKWEEKIRRTKDPLKKVALLHRLADEILVDTTIAYEFKTIGDYERKKLIDIAFKITDKAKELCRSIERPEDPWGSMRYLIWCDP